ncbi:MAG: tRNA (N6-threonylcarbamoyladenosine(37)-N6)-methyltransferase TrmO [Tissierellia bacterium]|nr:tRNA (N6-threonylcarbamoyladenosine(37)-N6)-methyltransferase TrmO [Tissierellia bacterium]
MKIIMEPIGYIKSEFKQKQELPRQSVLNTDKRAILEILPKYKEGIEGIKENTYGIILFHFHQSTSSPLKLIPHGKEEMSGVFSSRSPNRPNGIGMSIVKFTKIEGSTLEFEGVDMLDGTPVLDIKPYNPELNPK